MIRKAGRAVLLLVVSVVATGPSATAQLQTWEVEEERELEPGFYTKVLAKQDGWVTFRVESREGVRCFTQKPQRGENLPLPYKDYIVVSGEPHIQLGGGYGPWGDEASWTIKGKEEGGAEYRKVGDRFMKPATVMNNDFSVSGHVIEFKYEGWEYPHSLVGFYEAVGEFDLTGMLEAKQRQEDLCSEAFSNE